MCAYRIISAVLIVILSAGSLAAQEIFRDALLWQKMAAELHPGTSVQVRLKDRSRIRGMVVTTSDERFIIKPATRIAVPPVSINFADIESIEPWREGLTPGMKVLMGVGIGVGTFMLTAAIIFAHGFD